MAPTVFLRDGRRGRRHSALVAVLLGEPERDSLIALLAGAENPLISAATLASIVMQAKTGDDGVADLDALLAAGAVRCVAGDSAQARTARDAFARFGTGRAPSGLNFGDCFSYALARVTNRLAALQRRRFQPDRHHAGRRLTAGSVGQTAAMPSTRIFERLVLSKNVLVTRFARVLVLEEGRRAGDPETRVALDHLLPSPGDEKSSPRARWRLATSSARLYPPPVARESLSAWHGADGAKGRRLLVSDLANDNRVAALLAWHFEPSTSGRPHLITAAALRLDTDQALEAEYLVALWLLVCVSCAIDRRTIGRGRVGLIRDRAIGLDARRLELLGFRRGRRADGYEGDNYAFDA